MDKFGIECKQLMQKEIKEKIGKFPNFFISSFLKMGVPEQEQLRRKLKEINATLFLVKNRIAKRALEDLGKKEIASFLKGPSALALGGDDYILVSKALVDFANKNENFRILAGYIEQKLIDAQTVKALARIPSKEILLMQIVGSIKSPIQNLINALSGITRGLVVILDQIRKQKEPGGENG